jgi:hypothetical protein
MIASPLTGQHQSASQHNLEPIDLSAARTAVREGVREIFLHLLTKYRLRHPLLYSRKPVFPFADH